MAQKITVRVQAGEALQFPNDCVHCGQRATDRMKVRKRQGQLTRAIAVPICDDCQRELQRLSANEERWRQMGWLFGGLFLIVAWLTVGFILPGWLSLGWRLLLALIPAVVGGLAILLYFRQASARYARPEKKAILASARLCDFSWGTATLAFENDSFAQQFETLNESRLVKA